MNKGMRIVSLLLAVLLASALSSCAQQGKAKNADLAAVMADLEKNYRLTEMMTLNEDDLLDLYGIAKADVKQFAGRLPLDSLLADEIVLIEASDAQAAGRVKEKLDNRYQAKLNENKDYLPDEYAKVSGCKVVLSGNYVSMIISSDAAAMTTDYDKAFK